MLEDRGRALDALVHGEIDHWYLEHDTGRSTKLLALSSASRSSSVRSARAWRLFRAVSWGERALGLDQAVELTFWEVGASGQREMIGTRGHERFDQRSEPTVEIVEGRSYPGRRAFPVGADLEHDDSPIDIVYTWVDGDDPAWRSQFEHWSRSSGRSLSEGAFEEGRFHSRDELRYSLRSVWAFAGWARHIYIVTAGQRPPWLADHERISVIDHAEILPADALPTFNSHAIESAIHRIGGLAEQFIYFNDDVFLGRSTRPEQFFTSNGLPLVFLSGARTPGFVDDASLDVDRAAQRGRDLLAERFGRVAASKPYHTPFPLLRSVMEEIATEFAQIVDETAHSRFRSPNDLSIASSFAQHYALATQRGVAGRIRNEYVHVESGRLDWHLDRLRLGRFFDTFCINETEQTAEGAEDRERTITAFFESYFPVPAPWESDRSNGQSPSSMIEAVKARSWRAYADLRRLATRAGSAGSSGPATAGARRRESAAWTAQLASRHDAYRAAVAPLDEPVAVMCVSARPHCLAQLLESVAQQSHGVVEFVLVTNGAGYDEIDVEELVAERSSGLGAVTVLRRPPDQSLGASLNEAMDATDARFVAKFDDDDLYGADYVTDAMRAHAYAGAAVVGKHTYYAYSGGRGSDGAEIPGARILLQLDLGRWNSPHRSQPGGRPAISRHLDRRGPRIHRGVPSLGSVHVLGGSFQFRAGSLGRQHLGDQHS